MYVLIEGPGGKRAYTVSDDFGPKTKTAQKLPNFRIQTCFDLENVILAFLFRWFVLRFREKDAQ